MKRLIQNLFWPHGSTATIMRGPLKGRRFVVSDLTGWASIVNCWEPGALALYDLFVKPGDTVYDLGANTGMHSLAFSKLVGERGRVVAFEPMPQNIREIESVISLNGLANVEIAPYAVADRNGEAEFATGRHAKQGSLTGTGMADGATVKVQTITLDSYAERSGRLPNFVKMDIEGAEGMAVAGFSEGVRKAQPVFSIDLHTPEQDLLIGAFFERNGYRLYRFDAESSRARETLTLIKNMHAGWPTPDGVHGNVLALPPGRDLP